MKAMVVGLWMIFFLLLYGWIIVLLLLKCKIMLINIFNNLIQINCHSPHLFPISVNNLEEGYDDLPIYQAGKRTSKHRLQL
jgi:hypothetical protein